MSNKNLIEDLKLATTPSDLLSDEERELHAIILNTFEKIAETSMTKSIKTVIDLTADELDIEASEVAKVLDAYYTEENNKDAIES